MMINNNNNNKLNSWAITGLMDAEWSFGVNIIADGSRKLGYIISAHVEMGLNFEDKALLEKIKATLGVGNIYYNSKDNTYKWKVSDINQISNVIIPHFTIFYLVTQKWADFEILKQIVEIIKSKRHLTVEGLQEIVNLKASLNLGLSDDLKAAFPNTVPVFRPKINLNSWS